MKKNLYRPVTGRTYSLFGNDVTTKEYYATVRQIMNDLLERYPDQRMLLMHIQKASGIKFGKKKSSLIDPVLIAHIKETIGKRLYSYTAGVKDHLRNLSISQRLDPTLKTKEFQYHLYMLEIDLVNRLYKEPFSKSEYKFALLPHCLRDFRPDCKSVPGEFEHVCSGCTDDCFIRLGSVLLRKYSIHPHISVSIDLESLFKRLKSDHPSIGALGIACIPELVQGMRLCIKLDIPPVGIPLNANRCARWMKETRGSSFDLKELEDLINTASSGTDKINEPYKKL
jgi:hypothetical protein